MARLVLVGGFLGAGKTTLLLQAAIHLKAQGYRVGLITNDQGQNLVDTTLLEQQGFSVSEVAGGCFCCKFPDLLNALTKLQTATEPDIILAEPVGSCTDLVATILRPLARYYPTLQLAPLSILLDPFREINSFTSQIRYLYEQQLAEANIILLNKADLLPAHQPQETLGRLQNQYPYATVLKLSAQTAEGLEPWLNLVLNSSRPDTVSLNLDYQRYAEAEAALGWLNTSGTLTSTQAFSAINWLETLLGKLHTNLTQLQAPIAHIKLQIQTKQAFYKASLTGLESPIHWNKKPDDNPVKNLNFILNARVNTSPETLEQTVLYALETAKPEAGSSFFFETFECFQPTAPSPTYRIP